MASKRYERMRRAALKNGPSCSPAELSAIAERHAKYYRNLESRECPGCDRIMSVEEAQKRICSDCGAGL